MHLIIDSGATKTEYLFVNEGKICDRLIKEGININYINDNQLHEIIANSISSFSKENIAQLKKISFYGAGCGNPLNVTRIESVLQIHFPQTILSVASDLLAACHALCGDQPGWVAILGTGSSSCLYDGKKISKIAPSLGFMIGDEGSGTHLGKLLITAYLWEELPLDLREELEKEYEISYPKVLEHLYQKPYPNRFLSSFAPFMLKNSHHPAIKELCKTSFSDFITRQYHYFQHDLSEKRLNIMGSVAFHFKDIIIEIAKEKGISIQRIIASPGEHLIDYYHIENNNGDK